MRMYNSLGPNPRCVRIFMAEKGMTLDTIEVDILGTLASGIFGPVRR